MRVPQRAAQCTPESWLARASTGIADAAERPYDSVLSVYKPTRQTPEGKRRHVVLPNSAWRALIRHPCAFLWSVAPPLLPELLNQI